MKKLLFCVGVFICFVWNITAQNTNTSLPGWITRPLSLADCLNIALQQNATILKAKNDLEASHGVVVQTRAVALPQVQATGQYKDTDPHAIEILPGITSLHRSRIKTGTRACKSFNPFMRAGKWSRRCARPAPPKSRRWRNIRPSIADTLLAVRLAYYDVLLAAQQITVNEASVNLLQKELEDQQRRYDAGTVPHFNVLRAEVAVANERPALIQARNNYRIAKNNLSNLLGYNLPRDIWEDIPLNLTDTLDAAPYQVDLPDGHPAGAGQTHRTGRAAQNGGVAAPECRQRQGRLQTDGSGLRRL